MYIGNVLIENNLIFAPMAGITDSPTRIIARRFGAGMVYSEMISSEGLVRNQRKTKELLYFTSSEHPLALQIFGSHPECMGEAAKIICNSGVDIIDINFGCPAKKVLKAQSGAYLLQFPDKIAKIISRVRSKIKIPLTVKIRSGWDKENINALLIARIAQEEGADALIIHPRTRSQMFKEHADWDIITQIKKSVKIPVIGNGDVISPMDARRMFQETDCDAVMIGRGALGNPWLFNITDHFLRTGEFLSQPGIEEKIKIALQHLEYEVQYKGEKRGIKESYKLIFWYLKGLPETHKVRQEIIKQNSLQGIKDILEEYLKANL